MAARVITQVDPKDHLLDLLVKNEDTSGPFQALVDQVAPGAVAAARAGEAVNRVIEAKLSEIDKTKAELDKALHSTRVKAHVDGERSKLLSSPFAREHGITASDLPAIEKIMLDPESATASHLTAAKLYVNARILGAPRGEYEPGIQFPRNDMGDYWKGAPGRGITDGPPRQMGDKWAHDRALKDVTALMNGRALEPAPFPIPEVDARGHIRGGV